jgi:hypothetical protein
MNLNEAARAHIERFRYLSGQRIKARNALQFERNLNDDYVKFLGFSSTLLPLGAGILGMITNRMYLESESLVGLRQWFSGHFDKIYVVDLWGSSEESRRVEWLANDENVFDILQGVAVSFFIKRRPSETFTSIAYARELIGKREEKYRLLLEDLHTGEGGWKEVRPSPGMWWLHRTTSNKREGEREFTLAEIFPQFSTLVASNRDHLVVNFDREVVIRNVDEVRSFRGSNEELSRRFGITLKSGWNINAARAKLRNIPDLSSHMEVIEYRPFDRRWIFFHQALVWQTAPVSSNNLLGSRVNKVLISLGKNRAETVNGQWVSRTLADKSVVSTRDNASGFPLYLYSHKGGLGISDDKARPNVSQEFLRYLANRFEVSENGSPKSPFEIKPEEIFNYTYAVLYSPTYRRRYSEYLKNDFPRLPLPGSRDLLVGLARLGDELVALHLVESPILIRSITTYIGPKYPRVERISWSDNTVWLDAPATRKGQPARRGTIGFRGVPEEIWNFHVGGYQVCEKWLKDRKGRILSIDDISHYQKIVVAINETIRIMKEIDEVIDRYGGWPDAFKGRSDTPSRQDAKEDKGQSDSKKRLSVSEKLAKYEPVSMPLLKVAEPVASQYAAKDEDVQREERVDPTDLETCELVYVIRQLFNDGSARERGAAIGELGRVLGYQRISPQIRGELENAIRTSVRRGVLENRGDGLAIFVRSIDDYDRDFLKEQFLSSLSGRRWVEREDAYRLFARWMGFRRAGKSIEEAARSLVNGLIRDGRLESEGTRIRRCG